MPSLYIHIPFCRKRCIYCDFISGIYSPEKEDAYIPALKKEIGGISGKVSFKTLYIGGGTPTLLSNKGLKDLISHIFNHLSFVDNYEATIEANPGTVDLEKLKAIRKIGMNRISIGVQSFNDKELAFLGRLHSSDDAEQAVCLARDTGFEDIGLDLMYGIPGQDIESWKRTLDKAVSLKPEHISAYELTPEKGTLLYELLNNPPTSPFAKRGIMDDERIIEMYNYAIDYLDSEGFIHYEISNFALPDYFCKHNLNYWDRGEYYGVGLGAHSFINGKRFFNTDSFENYIKTLSENRNPVKEREDITEDITFSEAVFLGLRKTEGINLKSFAERYGKDILTLYQKEIKELQGAGLIELHETGSFLRLSKKGLLLSNEVFTRLM